MYEYVWNTLQTVQEVTVKPAQEKRDGHTADSSTLYRFCTFYNPDITTGNNTERNWDGWGCGGHGCLESCVEVWILWALPCKIWPHTHTHIHFDNVSWAHFVYIKGPTTRGLTSVLGSMKKENFMMFISLWFYLTPVLLWRKCARCVWRLFTAQGVVIVCWWDVLAFFLRLTDCLLLLAVSSAPLIENAVICPRQMFEGGTNERGRKEEGIPAWCVVLFWAVFNILRGI